MEGTIGAIIIFVLVIILIYLFNRKDQVVAATGNAKGLTTKVVSAGKRIPWSWSSVIWLVGIGAVTFLVYTWVTRPPSNPDIAETTTVTEPRKKVNLATVSLPSVEKARREMALGAWEISVSPEAWTRSLCPVSTLPGGSYSTLERRDDEVGLVFAVRRPGGKVERVVRPPGNAHLDLGALECFRVLGTSPTKLDLTITEDP